MPPLPHLDCPALLPILASLEMLALHPCPHLVVVAVSNATSAHAFYKVSRR